MNETRRTRPQVTVEDLLRLKRTERPPAAFWRDFEREMRVKQLAAIVEPRPWWAPLIRIHARFARYQMPVGATAILALTLVTVREYRLPEAEASFVPEAPVARLDAMPGPAVELAGQDAASEAAAAALAASAEADAAVAVRAESFPDGLSQRLPMLGGAEVMVAVDTPSARSIAANLAAVKASEPELARFLDRLAGLESRAQASRSPAVDPLVNLQSPSDARRARVLSTALPVAASASADANERRYQPRLGRDLTDERLYERVSRIDLEGKRLAINFKL
ncbi:MAG: hypothetical protein KF897_09060 [Opitutaceae bacterium]|nr:hypothetical protein [Opitutaceae bacterium]